MANDNIKQQKSNKKKSGKPRTEQQPVTSDPRFSQVYSDPRFKAPKKKDLRIKIDDRFSKEELGINKSSAKVDRYGRKLNKQEDKTKVDLFDKYYKKEEETDEEESEESDSSNSADEDEISTGISALDRARGIGQADSDIETSSSDDDSDLSGDNVEEESEIEIEDERPPEGEPTSTFACVNMDWDHITSTDLLATFSSFVPTGGKIYNVAIYPSEYGRERMQKEEIEGPSRDLFKSEKKVESDSDDDSDDDGEIDVEKATRELYEEDDGADYNSKALRSYQLQRLRYYYAVVKCDSITTSQRIYEACDGSEYESTANLFDLRYVPADMKFDQEPRDQCSRVPASYKPSEFTTDALQHSKVKLTWDETPAERLSMATKAFSQKEIEDMDFKAYLASDSEDSEDDNEDMKTKYKNLASGSTKIGNVDIFGEGDGDEDDVDMEITFTPGLSNTGKKADIEKESEDESTINAFQKKEKERRKKRKEKVKELKRKQEEQKRAEKEKARSQKAKFNKKVESTSEEDARSRAELELVMMDDNNKDMEDQHFTMKDVLKAEKLRKMKKTNKKDKKKQAELNVDTDIKIDESDNRFDEIFEDHRFAIDPTNTEFKKTAVMENILKSGQKKHKKDNEVKKTASKKRKHSEVESTADHSESVSDLVNKIKRKSGKK